MSGSNGDSGFLSQEQQLQAAIGQAFDDLDSRWWDCVRSPQSTSPSKGSGSSPFFQLGKRLGQFLIPPTLAMGAVASKLALLKETEAIRSKKKLNTLDAEATTILARQLPQLEIERDSILREQQACEAEKPKSGWKGSLWEIGFYLAISVALFIAEFSLATQITQEALLLRSPWVFSIALACLTLAFKFLADRFFTEKGSGLIYLCTMIVLFIGLMLPVSLLRTKTVLASVDDVGFNSSGVQWGDTPGAAPAVDPMPGAAEDQTPRASDPVPSANHSAGSVDTSTPFYLKASFFLSSILFPLLSGAGFSRFQSSLNFFQEERSRKSRIKDLHRALVEMEDSYKKAYERLSFMGEETSQVIVTLGESLDVLGFYVYRLTDLLIARGADRQLVGSAAAALSKNPGPDTLDAFLTAARSSGTTEPEEPRERLQLEYYVRLLNTAISSRHTSKLDLLERQLSGQVSAEVEAGFMLGKKTRYQVFAGENKDELLRIADLNTYHSVFFDEEAKDDDR